MAGARIPGPCLTDKGEGLGTADMPLGRTATSDGDVSATTMDKERPWLARMETTDALSVSRREPLSTHEARILLCWRLA